MNTCLVRKDCTSAFGAMNLDNNSPIRSVIIQNESTNTTYSKIPSPLSVTLDMTTNGVTSLSNNSTEVSRKAVMERRRLTGFTWEQLAQLFNVSRRTLHFWASGQKLNSFNEQQLYLLLDTIRYIDRGSASLNRSILLNPFENETRPFDLLIAGKYNVVKNIVGSTNLPKKTALKPLSEEALRLRKPLDPETLVSADPTPIHKRVGRSRPAS